MIVLEILFATPQDHNTFEATGRVESYGMPFRHRDGKVFASYKLDEGFVAAAVRTALLIPSTAEVSVE